MYFWRTRQKQEIDYIEEWKKKLYAFEFKWNVRKSAKIPTTFSKTYTADEKIIDRDNFREFVLPEKQ